jgi:hypothetical protein
MEVIRRLGARRFEAQNMCVRSQSLMAKGKHAQALPLIREAVSLARETGISFVGPIALGCLARATDDEEERMDAMSEAESLLASGAVGHNYIWFYREVLERVLERGEWSEVGQFVDAWEKYTSAEPLPWSDFFIARARVLAAVGEGRRDEVVIAELTRLRDLAVTVGFKGALKAIKNALEAQQAAE